MKLLRLHLDSEGRRTFDALNLRENPTLRDTLMILEKHWGVRMNTCASRYKSTQMKQTPGKHWTTSYLVLSVLYERVTMKGFTRSWEKRCLYSN